MVEHGGDLRDYATDHRMMNGKAQEVCKLTMMLAGWSTR
jgi:hypothetical protein